MCHLVFDVKMDFTRKSRYVAIGWYAPQSDESRYIGVLSHDSVRTNFTYANLNGIGIMEVDIHNAYLTSPCYDKYCTRCGMEFGS